MIPCFYHIKTETVGYIGDVLSKLSLAHKPVLLYENEPFPSNPESWSGLIIMGGPMNVDETDAYPYLKQETEIIAQLIEAGKPVLGICLGAQLIAKAMGSRVFPNGTKEEGWAPIQVKNESVFASIPSEIEVVHWHGDTFDLPAGAVHLAQSKDCKNQAFHVGEKVLGLQFHLEATAEIVQAWFGDAVKGSEEKWKKLKPVSDQIFTTYFSNAYR